MNKKIAALLSIALLISLTGCGGNSGGNDLPPSERIEATETQTKALETAPEATGSEEPTYIPTESETPTEAITEPTEDISESTEPPAAEQPKETPAPVATVTSDTPAPQTAAPTAVPAQTPAPAHTHNYVVTQAATCTSNGVKTCSCGDTQVIPATGHQFTTYTVPEEGHYEQVQVGEEQVVVGYETHWVYQCSRCGRIDHDADAAAQHRLENLGHGGSVMWEEKTPIYETQAVYEDQWVVDTPASTIRVCEVCGQEEP